LEGDTYDGTKLNLFLARLQVKAEKYNWNIQGMLTFGNCYLLTHYGEITMAQVEQAAEAYQPLVDWLSQNSAMMFSCIYDSRTTEFFAKVNTDPSRYCLMFVVLNVCCIKYFRITKVIKACNFKLEKGKGIKGFLKYKEIISLC
jgi:hypothetical protein